MVWIIGNAPLTIDLFFGNIIDLVAFRDGYIYTLVLSPEVMLDNNHPYTFISRISLMERYIDYFMHVSGTLPFGGIDFGHHIRFSHEQNITTLYYVDSRELYGGVSNTLFMVPWATDDDKPVHLPPFHSREIWHRESPRRPFISYSEEHIILNFIDGNSYVLGYIRYDDPSLRFVEVLRYDFTIDEYGLIVGRIPIYASGDEYGIYFQVISLDREHIDFGGVSSLYFFCFESSSHEPILHLSDSITYVNGRNSLLVYNYYSVDNPRAMTGRIVSLDDNWSVTIPHITPVNSILYTSIEDEVVFIVSREHIIAYDLQTYSFNYLEVSSLSTGLRSNIRMSGSQFGWLCFGDGSEIVFNYVNWQNLDN